MNIVQDISWVLLADRAFVITTPLRKDMSVFSSSSSILARRYSRKEIDARISVEFHKGGFRIRKGDCPYILGEACYNGIYYI
jgi:uncharacterized protein with ATP-grasp and redox domains